METTNVGSGKLMQELKPVVSDTEELLKVTAGDAIERVTKARARAEESLRQAMARLVEIEHDIAARARGAAQATNAYVHENPWPSIGVAAGAHVRVELFGAIRAGVPETLLWRLLLRMHGHFLRASRPIAQCSASHGRQRLWAG